MQLHSNYNVWIRHRRGQRYHITLSPDYRCIYLSTSLSLPLCLSLSLSPTQMFILFLAALYVPFQCISIVFYFVLLRRRAKRSPSAVRCGHGPLRDVTSRYWASSSLASFNVHIANSNIARTLRTRIAEVATRDGG